LAISWDETHLVEIYKYCSQSSTGDLSSVHKSGGD